MTGLPPDSVLKLCRVYSLGRVGSEGWYEELQMLADSELSDGHYHELYRSVLCDGPDRNLQTLKSMEKVIRKCGHELPTKTMMNAYHIEREMRRVSQNPKQAFKISESLHFAYFDELESDPFNIRSYLSTFYQWWADESEWMIGEQRIEAEARTITDLQAAANEWLQMHTPIHLVFC